MATTATLTISGTKTGLAAGSQTIGPLVIGNNSSGDADLTYNLASGNNTISVPPGAVYQTAVIIPPANNAVGLTLKGVGGDTGISIHPTYPTVLSFPSTLASIVINAAATVNGLVIAWL